MSGMIGLASKSGHLQRPISASDALAAGTRWEAQVPGQSSPPRTKVALRLRHKFLADQQLALSVPSSGGLLSQRCNGEGSGVAHPSLRGYPGVGPQPLLAGPSWRRHCTPAQCQRLPVLLQASEGSCGGCLLC